MSAGFGKAHLASSEEVYMPASFLSDTLSLSDQLLDWCGWLVFSSAYPQPCFLHTSDRCRSLQKPNGKSLTLRQQLRETSSVVGYHRALILSRLFIWSTAFCLFGAFHNLDGALVYMPWLHVGAWRGQRLGACSHLTQLFIQIWSLISKNLNIYQGIVQRQHSAKAHLPSACSV